MGSRSYRQICTVSKALDLVGERWTLLIVRDLLPGPMSYTALLAGLPGLTTNLLAKRLKELTLVGLLEKDSTATDAKCKSHYRLTEAGAALGPVIGALASWGRKFGPAPSPSDSINFRWLLLLFSRHYQQTGNRWIVQLDCDEKSLQVRLGGSEFEGVEGAPMRPDLIVKADGPTYFALLFGNQSAAELLAGKSLALHAGPSAEDLAPIWLDFLTSFQLD